MGLESERIVRLSREAKEKEAARLSLEDSAQRKERLARAMTWDLRVPEAVE